jgi:hypothetical protein
MVSFDIVHPLQDGPAARALVLTACRGNAGVGREGRLPERRRLGTAGGPSRLRTSGQGIGPSDGSYCRFYDRKRPAAARFPGYAAPLPQHEPKATLDAVLLDSFTADLEELAAEQEHIHRQITEEDMAFDRILTPSFRFIDPNTSLTSALYRLLRERNLFTHDIAYPSVRYYQTEENRDGEYFPVEVSADYISAHSNTAPYVPDLD